MKHVAEYRAPMDLLVTDDDGNIVLGRPWVILSVDVRTRAIVGWNVVLGGERSAEV